MHTPATDPTVPALLVGVDFGQPHFDRELHELAELARTANLTPTVYITCRRNAPDAAFFVGRGKMEEIRDAVQAQGIQEILFDQALSPVQQRNLEKAIGVPVNDRTYLILEIFAQRARSHEGKLQVELARLQYLSTRLVRLWSHLERQHGGIGQRGGPGERQIELDRRMIRDTIRRTKDKLKKVQRQHDTQRRQRVRGGVFRIALVGYTNAGKSTLFNALVKARSYVANQLFATLDTTTRQLYLEEAGRAITLSDTVGFIRDLPHTLVDAFKATLQEAVDADLLLHVVDGASPDLRDQIDEVERVLQEIGAAEIPQVLVFNKLDLLDAARRPQALQDVIELERAPTTRIFASAVGGEGLALLRAEMARRAAPADDAAAPDTAAAVDATAPEEENQTHDESL